MTNEEKDDEYILICSICGAKFDIKREGGIDGFIGIIPLRLCPFCESGIVNFFEQVMCSDCEYKNK